MKHLALQKPSLARLSAVLLNTIMALIMGCSEPSLPVASLESTSKYAPPYQTQEAFPGGNTSASTKPFISFQLPAANMPDHLKSKFYAGQALAKQPWVKAPTITTARDGLGPLYNARTCLSCHIKGGKGFISDTHQEPLLGTLIRLSVPGLLTQEFAQTGVIPHPVYGDQIQAQSISLAHQLRHSQKPGTLPHTVAPEAYVYIQWHNHTFTYPDQHQVPMRRPSLDFRNLGYGPLGKDTLFSIRVAPAIHGMGLLALIPQQDINALADEHDNNHDGVSGRVNVVWDADKSTMAPGRFGLKANKPTLKMTVAGAFSGDLGISNSLFPQQPCTRYQVKCNESHNGNDADGFELPDHLLELVVDFNRNLAPLKRTAHLSKNVIKGRELFYQVGCNQCHNPSFKTAKSKDFPHLGEQTIWPYSDLLLHDLGEKLSDNRPDFLASGREWRTPPLWGVGVQHKVNGSQALLHDGRARSVEEAILWHAGEAQKTTSKFINLPRKDRDALMYFVNSL
jgi:CxxC motif-containing protein (DUF1111 family)